MKEKFKNWRDSLTYEQVVKIMRNVGIIIFPICCSICYFFYHNENINIRLILKFIVFLCSWELSFMLLAWQILKGENTLMKKKNFRLSE